jgi:hypothetical protein
VWLASVITQEVSELSLSKSNNNKKCPLNSLGKLVFPSPFPFIPAP